MRYTVPHWFSVGKNSFGGYEDVCAKSPEEAVAKARALHPNVTLRIGVLREREGPYAGRKIVVQGREASHGR